RSVFASSLVSGEKMFPARKASNSVSISEGWIMFNDIGNVPDFASNPGGRQCWNLLKNERDGHVIWFGDGKRQWAGALQDASRKPNALDLVTASCHASLSGKAGGELFAVALAEQLDNVAAGIETRRHTAAGHDPLAGHVEIIEAGQCFFERRAQGFGCG